MLTANLENKSPSNLKKYFSLAFVIFLFLAIPLTVFLVSTSRDDRSEAVSGNGNPPNKANSYTMGVLVLKYFPTQDGTNLDSSVTGVVSTLSFIRTKVDRITTETKTALQSGSIFHGYKDSSATADLNYSIVDQKEYLTSLPLGIEVPWKPGQGIYRPDYGKILTDLNICNYVNNQSVREVWLYGWHYGNIEPAESVMSGPNGDVSNSGGGNFNMPVCSKSYVLYNYNYSRDTAEAVHDHGHQIEIMLEHIDNPLVQNNFIGAWQNYGSNDGSGSNFHRCGWTHAPPNTATEYDYSNNRYSWSDCQDWTADGTGQKTNINCSAWSCTEVGFHTWRWQNMPGKNNPDARLSNWWDIIGDFDQALARGEKLTYIPTSSPPPPPSSPPPTPSSTAENTTSNHSSSGTKATQTATFDLKVTFVNENNEPIPNTLVTLYSTPVSSTTDKNGAAVFANVASGNHTIVVELAKNQVSVPLFVADASPQQIVINQSTKKVVQVKKLATKSATTSAKKTSGLNPWAWFAIALGSFSFLGLLILVIHYGRKNRVQNSEPKTP